MFKFGTITSQGFVQSDEFDPDITKTVLLLSPADTSQHPYTFNPARDDYLKTTYSQQPQPTGESPYRLYWSGFFHPDSDHRIQTNNSIPSLGTGDFTIEFWINFTEPSVDALPRCVISRTANDFSGFQIFVAEQAYTTNGVTTPIGGLVFKNDNNVLGTSIALNDNEWHHVVFLRRSGIMESYVDGVLKQTIEFTANLSSTLPIRIGTYYGSTSQGNFKGYLSDLRITKRSLYEGNFLVPTDPHEYTPDCMLLTLNQGTVVDESNVSGIDHVNTGAPEMVEFHPFMRSGSMVRDDTYRNHSYYFDGTDRLIFNFGSPNVSTTTTDFTVEMWIKPTRLITNQSYDILDFRSAGNTDRPRLVFESGRLRWITSSGSVETVAVCTGTISGSTTLNVTGLGNSARWAKNTALQAGTPGWMSTYVYIVNTGTGAGGLGTYSINRTNNISTSSSFIGHNVYGQKWQHIAYSVKNGIGRFFVDGVLINTVTDNYSYTMPYQQCVVGKGYLNTNGFVGHISNLRISGECLYESEFRPSTVPLTATSSTLALLCKLENVTDRDREIRDESQYKHNLINTVKNLSSLADLDNPFNTSTSYSFVPAVINTWLTVEDDPNFDLSDDDFTIEFWLKNTDPNTYAGYFNQYSVSYTSGWNIWSSTSTLYALVAENSSQYVQLSTAYASTGWNHVSLVRDSSILRLFVNGQTTSTSTISFAVGSPSAPFQFGRSAHASLGPMNQNGRLSGVRIVKGKALYKNDFAVPTSPPENIAGTIFLSACTNRYKDYSPSPGSYATGTTTYADMPIIKYEGPFRDHNKETGSMYFNAACEAFTDELTAYAISTNNFTIEGFGYLQGGPSGAGQGPCYFVIGGIVFKAYNAGYWGEPGVQGGLTNNGGTGPYSRIVAASYNRYNQWIHWAVQRIGAQWTIFFDGKIAGIAEYGNNPQSGTREQAGAGPSRVTLGTQWIGNVHGVRYTLGEALYYSPHIDVPTSPRDYADPMPVTLSNQRLLLNEYGDKDNQTAEAKYGITNRGLNALTSINEYVNTRSPFSPKGWVSKFYPSSGSDFSGAMIASTSTLKIEENQAFTLEFWAYPSETRQWSAFFNGSDPAVSDGSRQWNGTGFSAATPTGWTNVGGNFTVECWVYLRGFNGNFFVFGANTIAYNGDLGIVFGPNGGSIYIKGTGTGGNVQYTFYASFPDTIPLNQWNHVAFVRNSSSIWCFLNGVRGADGGGTGANGAISPYLNRSDLATAIGYHLGRKVIGWTEGLYGPDGYLDGWMSNFRFNNGSAIYTADFTPPSMPLKHLPTPGGTSHLRLFDGPGKPGINGTNVSVGSTATQIFKRRDLRLEEFGPTWASTGTESMIYFGRRQLVADANFGLQVTQQDATFAFRGNNTSTAAYSTTTFAAPMAYNTWSHIAIVRTTSGHITSYINGIPGTTVINTGAIDPYSHEESFGVGTTNQKVYFHLGYGPAQLSRQVEGDYWKGWMSDVRLVKDQALYLNTFTPSRNRPLEAISGTTLLTLQGLDNLKDNSPINHEIVTIDPDDAHGVDNDIVPLWDQKSGSNLETQGGACHFAGSGDYIILPARSYFNLRYVSQWTFETWFRLDATSAGLIDSWFWSIGGGSWASIAVGTNNSTETFKLYYSNGNAGEAVTTNSSIIRHPRKWYHIAISRDSNGVIRMFVNGKLDIEVTPSFNLWNGQFFYLNSLPNGNSGGASVSLAGVRFVTNNCLYTQDFDLPGSMPRYVEGTKVLMPFSGAPMADRSGVHGFEVNNTGTTATMSLEYSGLHKGSAVRFNPVYFTESLRIDDKLSRGHRETPTLNIFNKDFTLEMWVNRVSGTSGTLFSLLTNGTTGIGPLVLKLGSNGAPQLLLSSDGMVWDVNMVSTVTSLANEWVHIAVSLSGRNNNNLKLFVNGQLGGYTTYLNSLVTFDDVNGGVLTGSNGNTYIGALGTTTPSELFRGLIYDVRFTIGKGRYTNPEGFTRPRRMFPIR